MDHLLTREESIRLMQLLELPMDEFGNFNAMRSQFHKQIKKMHPDKGGNPEQAKELISLYKKLEEKISPLQPDSDATTTEQVYEQGQFFLYLKDWVSCNRGESSCACLFCMLKANHEKRKRERKHNVWGHCFCFQCYITWFGLEHSWMDWLSWRNVIANTPYGCLNI
ncbi:small t antigen [Bat polyomavirus 6d]|uniref:small t antigen n=1 Tax=Bat polyomavirus 6d TaxID=1623686 RepID=UPI0005D8FA31|nr:small t antigen [Bat polyomavirus 6d]BAQ55557.1 small t antigen [Bat polyomavirus 6d]BAQ55561.1 small t antigen [Bat polyomavirus 6d]